MLTFQKIRAVALYEFITLRRSWLFRIFAFLSIAAIILLNFVLYAYSETATWTLRGIPSSIPYMNLLVLNIIQGIIGIFVASEFFKNDKLHDFTEAVYTRSMTNADYILGKTLGICALFLFLNVFILLISSLFNIVFTDDVPFILKSYIYYPIIISIPTLIFIFGLSFFLMALIKSQALTILILLGYIIFTHFIIGGNFYQLFDYSAFNLPLMYSDFIGFGNVGNILIQRGMYLLLGAGLIFSSVLMFKRPRQSQKMNRVSLIAAVVCFISVALLGSTYVSNKISGEKLRSRMNMLNYETASKPRVSVTDCNLDLVHRGKNIEVNAKLAFENKTSSSIDSYNFSLNPGLEILDITKDGKKLDFSRDLHILTVKPQAALNAGGIDSLSIHYKGTISENAAYIDIEETERQELFKLFVYNIDKRYGFITPEYVLLTHENLWYPIAGIPYGAAFPSLQEKDFINFGLYVTTDSELTAISQGEMKRTGNSDFVFTPDAPMPQLSLVIGRYEKYSLTVEDTDYNIFYRTGHDYFSQYFNLIHDELPDLINESKMDFERNHILSYPYKRFSLVEVPIQYSSYDRLWTLSRENIQPEQVFLPEKGLFVTDFNRSISVIYSPNMENTPEEKQKSSYRSIVRNHIMQGNTVRQQQNNSGLTSIGGNNMKQQLRAALYFNSDTRYNISSNYYSFVNHFASDEWPIFNFSLEYFLFQKTLFESESQDRANIALSKQTFPEILSGENEWYDAYAVIRTKAEYIFTLIKSTLGNEVFEEFMYDYLNDNRFKNVDIRDFIAAVNERFSLDLEPHLNQWYNEKNLPAFRIADVNLYEVIHEDKTKYQITFKIQNTEDVDGVVLLSFDAIPLGGLGLAGLVVVIGGNNAVEDRVIALKGNQSKEISMLFDTKPHGMNINTLISQNLPSSVVVNYLTSNQEPKKNDTIEVYDGERILDTFPDLTDPGMIIVDNEDPGFKVLTQPQQSILKKFLDKNSEDDEYLPYSTNNPPEKWTAAVHNDFYGTFKHTAHYIKSGTGTQKVEWSADIPENGKYDIFCQTTSTKEFIIRIGDDTLGGKTVDDLNFKIYHDDGVDEKSVVDAEKGWTFLGTYPLSKGTARIELSDKSKGKIVYADAVKWVKMD